MEYFPERNLHIYVDYEARDFIRASLWRYYFNWPHSILVWFIVLFAAFLCSMCIKWVLTDPDIKFRDLIFPICFSAYIVLGFPITSYLGAKLQFAGAKDFQKHAHFVFGMQNDGYDVSDQKSSSHVSWEIIDKIIETKHAFHIYIHNSPFIVLPKRAINKRGDIEHLREIFVSKIGKRAKLRTSKELSYT